LRSFANKRSIKASGILPIDDLNEVCSVGRRAAISLICLIVGDTSYVECDLCKIVYCKEKFKVFIWRCFFFCVCRVVENECKVFLNNVTRLGYTAGGPALGNGVGSTAYGAAGTSFQVNFSIG
jgi:hypothetical protein